MKWPGSMSRRGDASLLDRTSTARRTRQVPRESHGLSRDEMAITALLPCPVWRAGAANRVPTTNATTAPLPDGRPILLADRAMASKSAQRRLAAHACVRVASDLRRTGRPKPAATSGTISSTGPRRVACSIRSTTPAQPGACQPRVRVRARRDLGRPSRRSRDSTPRDRLACLSQGPARKSWRRDAAGRNVPRSSRFRRKWWFTAPGIRPEHAADRWFRRIAPVSLGSSSVGENQNPSAPPARPTSLTSAIMSIRGVPANSVRGRAGPSPAFESSAECFAEPLREPAVEDRHFVVPHPSEQPPQSARACPNPGRRATACTPRVHAEAAERACQRRRIRQRMPPVPAR